MTARLVIVLLFAGMLALSAGADAEIRAVIAVGLGGTPEYEAEFDRQAGRLAKHLEAATDDLTVLQGSDARKESVRAVFDQLAGRTGLDDELLVIYVGHGSWDGERFRFNVPGPDFTGVELGEWLDTVEAQQTLVITSASSGALQNVLPARDARTLMTATRSGEQRNATVFGRYFTAALDDQTADLDKNRRVSITEAFRFAEARVEEHYGNADEMSTEHPVTSGPESSLTLALLEEQQESTTPAMEALQLQLEALESDVADLRANRDNYTQAEYFSSLQALLLEIALLEQRMRDESSGGGAP